MSNVIMSPEFMRKFEEAAFQIAEKKMAEGRAWLERNPPARKLHAHLPTGGGFPGLFLWDTAFCTLWARYAPERFPITGSLDNFYELQDDDGFIDREYTAEGEKFWSKDHPVAFAPPLLAWAELELFRAGVTDSRRIAAVRPRLEKLHEFNRRTWRNADGLYFGDALGCGMDDLPRFPVGRPYDTDGGLRLAPHMVCARGQGFFREIDENPLYRWNRQMGWIDMSSQMAFDAANLAELATITGDGTAAAAWRDEHRELGAIINRKCYSPELGFYCDCYENAPIPRLHAGGFWPLIAGIVPPERRAAVLGTLADPRRFNRPVPFPALAADDPDYQPETGYWRGAVWPCTTYTVLLGLRKIGAEAFARDAARRYYDACATLYCSTGTIWENISPEQCQTPKKRAMDNFCGWGALGAVNIAREFLDR